jgi:signal transduction histidine kinase
MTKHPSVISLAAHELQAPLTALKVRLETALDADWCRGGCRDVLRRCLTDVRYMNQMVIDLLLLQKASSGELRSEGERLDLADVLRSVGKIFEPLAAKRQLRFEVYVVGSLPVTGERSGLTRILTNLLDNAFKYTDPGGRVSLEGRRTKDRAELSIKDTGCGIPPGAVQHVFEIFYQVDKTRDHEVGGTGLGLAVARALVENNGGKIGVVSEIGKGTAFTLTFPLATDE